MQFDEKNQFNGNSKEKMERAEIWEKEENQLKFGIVFAYGYPITIILDLGIQQIQDLGRLKNLCIFIGIFITGFRYGYPT